VAESRFPEYNEVAVIEKETRMNILAAVLIPMIWLAVAGCAEQKAAPAPSQRQVQSDSDRFFDKMKQEEREHGAEQGGNVNR
jgi:nitrous oxide reductase accessory protein NosL